MADIFKQQGNPTTLDQKKAIRSHFRKKIGAGITITGLALAAIYGGVSRYTDWLGKDGEDIHHHHHHDTDFKTYILGEEHVIGSATVGLDDDGTGWYIDANVNHTLDTVVDARAKIAELNGFTEEVPDEDGIFENPDTNEWVRIVYIPAIEGDSYVFGVTQNSMNDLNRELPSISLTGEGRVVAKYNVATSGYDYFVEDSTGQHVLTEDQFNTTVNFLEDGNMDKNYYADFFVGVMRGVSTAAAAGIEFIEQELKDYLNTTWGVSNETLAGQDLAGLLGVLLDEGNNTYSEAYDAVIAELFRIANDNYNITVDNDDLGALLADIVQYGENLTQLRETDSSELYSAFTSAALSAGTDDSAALRELDTLIQRFVRFDEFGVYEFDNSPEGIAAITYLAGNMSDTNGINNTLYEWIIEQYSENQRDVYIFNPHGVDAVAVAYDRGSYLPNKMEVIDEATEYDVIADAMSGYNS